MPIRITIIRWAHFNVKLHFYCYHGNWQKLENSEMAKIFVGPPDSDFQGVWLQNAGPS